MNELSWTERYERDRDRDQMLQQHRQQASQIAKKSQKQAHTVRKQQERIDRLLEQHTKQAYQCRHLQWQKLQEDHKREKQAIRDQTEQKIKEASKETYFDFRSDWSELRRKHRQQRSEFERNERQFLGRYKNAFRAVTLRSIMYGQNRGAVLSGIFSSIVSKQSRRNGLAKTQRLERRALSNRERRATDQAIQQVRDHAARQNVIQDKRYKQQHQKLANSHEREQHEINLAWKNRHEHQKDGHKNEAKKAFEAVAQRSNPQRNRDDMRAIRIRPADRRQSRSRDNEFERGR